ncbi:MAG: hypothetical protein BroJett018_27290 [Chloroflexota bacterium]|nr:MAG: hypothetical protein BroJett018_27290 [Chloroflexota bacterium]
MATPKFYLDSHITTEIVSQLRDKGVDIIHCSEDGMEDASDEEHLAYCTRIGRVMVTCDKGCFFQLHLAWQTDGKEHGGIVYFRMEDQCKSVSFVIRELLLLHEAADYPNDLYNEVWWAKS